jgi:hypothetical protein
VNTGKPGERLPDQKHFRDLRVALPTPACP